MINIFIKQAQGLKRLDPAPATLPDDCIWVDLVEPSAEEERMIEHALAIDVPTREEMKEIEASSRLYEEHGALFMTATVATKLDTDLPESAQVTFILAKNRLVTNRYVDPLPFRRFIVYAERHPSACTSAPVVLAGLIESVINRIADVIERVGADLDTLSAEIFAPPRKRRGGPRDFRLVLDRIGQSGDLTSKARESLVSLGRVLAFVQQSALIPLDRDIKDRFRSLSRDVLSLSDHSSFLGNKTTFLLEATLGMINIDQNNIIKIFSVVTVFLLPPSVIVGWFGMNFPQLPWLGLPHGPLIALGLMLLSAIIPFAIFKRLRWL
jgi:magnesium transporter